MKRSGIQKKKEEVKGYITSYPRSNYPSLRTIAQRLGTTTYLVKKAVAEMGKRELTR